LIAAGRSWRQHVGSYSNPPKYANPMHRLRCFCRLVGHWPAPALRVTAPPRQVETPGHPPATVWAHAQGCSLGRLARCGCADLLTGLRRNAAMGRGRPTSYSLYGKAGGRACPPHLLKRLRVPRQAPTAAGTRTTTATRHQGSSLHPIIPQKSRPWVTVSLQFGYSFVIFPRKEGVAGHERRRRPLSRDRQNG
jgi:hypothetical protein